MIKIVHYLISNQNGGYDDVSVQPGDMAQMSDQGLTHTRSFEGRIMEQWFYPMHRIGEVYTKRVES